MAIDLSTPEGRSSYLQDSLSDLINGVDSTYGTLIFDELIKRIDKTIKDFNSEMESIFEDKSQFVSFIHNNKKPAVQSKSSIVRNSLFSKTSRNDKRKTPIFNNSM